ncbi:MAG: hypothetical protein N2578_01380, partial [Bdellovibrionaceae bacterium]|nr:hypothetical protein [Pseudobdellovibrionaceae bacterium]
ITRAKEKLILCRCRQRKRHGHIRPVSLSRFLCDLPEGLLQEYETAYRPVTGKAREELVAGFLASLQQKSAALGARSGAKKL